MSETLHVSVHVHKRQPGGSGGSSRQAPRDPEPRRNPNCWASRAAFLLQIHTGGGGSKRQNAYKTTATTTQLGSPATCKLKSFRGFYGFREDIREARALREIDRSVVSSAAIRYAIKICNMAGAENRPQLRSARLGGDGVGTPSRALEHAHSFSRTRAHPQKKPSTSCHMRSYHQARERQSRARRGRADYMTNKSRRSISERAVDHRDVQRGRFAARLQALGYF